MTTSIRGSCLCGRVAYTIKQSMRIFQYCHCSRCRKFTGSAHGANLFVAPENFAWSKGEAEVKTYNPENTKYFATAFCGHCGSSLPWHSKGGRVVVVPAGTVDDEIDVKPSQNIFCGSRAAWYQSAADLPEYDELPPLKNR